jgi:transposase
VGWKDVIVPKPYPREFRDDVVRVARNRDDGVTIEQIASDFGVHPMTLTKWMRQADIDHGAKPG